MPLAEERTTIHLSTGADVADLQKLIDHGFPEKQSNLCDFALVVVVVTFSVN